MQEIDFLPTQYRHRHAQRQAQPWMVVVVAVSAILLATGALGQWDRKIRAQAELDAIGPQYAMAIAQNKRMVETQTRLAAARHSAELYTYLRHPWPRTQLLAALFAPLPDGLTLTDLQVSAEVPSNRAASERHAHSEADDDPKDDPDKLPPAARDLLQLREETDRRVVVVTLQGTTANGSEVHRYLGDLGANVLFQSAELDSLDAIENDPVGKQRFRAFVVVRPGYGQPGGPAEGSPLTIAQRARQEQPAEGQTQ